MHAKLTTGLLYAEEGIYRDNLSAIIYYRLSLSLKIVLIYRLPISFLQYILRSPLSCSDKRFFMHTVFKVSELALWRKRTVSINSCYKVKKSLFVSFIAKAEFVNCSLFLKKSRKTFLQFDFQKKLCQTH